MRLHLSLRPVHPAKRDRGNPGIPIEYWARENQILPYLYYRLTYYSFFNMQYPGSWVFELTGALINGTVYGDTLTY